MLKKLIQSLRSPRKRQPHPRTTPLVLSKRQHPLGRQQISRNALSVIERLQHSGYQAYAVGGCVRDLLLGLPKQISAELSAITDPWEVERRLTAGLRRVLEDAQRLSAADLEQIIHPPD